MFYPTTCVGLRYKTVQDMLSGFSREHGYRRCHLARGLGVLSAFSTRADLPAQGIPTAFNVLFRQHAGVSLLRLHIAPARGYRIFTVCPSGPALRLPLRPRLTLIRLALIRNRPVLRRGCFPHPLSLLMPTFAFPGPPARLAPRLLRLRECSPTNTATGADSTSSAPDFMPDYYPCGALSTSELLRTLQMNGCFQANILAVSEAPPRYCLQLSPDFGALDGGLSCSSLGRGP